MAGSGGRVPWHPGVGGLSVSNGTSPGPIWTHSLPPQKGSPTPLWPRLVTGTTSVSNRSGILSRSIVTMSNWFPLPIFYHPNHTPHEEMFPHNWIWLGFPLRSSQDFYIFLVVLGWLVCECSCLFSSWTSNFCRLGLYPTHLCLAHGRCPVNVWQANRFALLAKPPWTAQRTMICYVISYSPYGQNFTIWLHKQTTWIK